MISLVCRVATVHRFCVFLILFILCYTPVIVYVLSFEITQMETGDGESTATDAMFVRVYQFTVALIVTLSFLPSGLQT